MARIMGKRALPPGQKAVIGTISAPPAAWARWRRRAAEIAESKGGKPNVSRAIREDAEASMRLRHDLRGELSALAILRHDLLGHRVSFGVATERIRGVITGMMQKLADESPPGRTDCG
jgi:hypothetical protein